jgi:hypothetical protein
MRRLWKVIAGIVGVLLVATFAIPFAVRGPRFADLVLRFVPPLQGTLRLDSGGLGAGAFWAFVFGRPVPVHLEGLSVLDPEGLEVFRSERLTCAIEFQRHPLRLFLHDLRPGKSMWRFSRMKKRPGIGFLKAWVPRPRPEPVPPATPPPPSPPTAAKSPEKPEEPFRAAFGITNAHLDGLDAIFSFWGWGLELGDIKAKGFLDIQIGSGRPPITFDAREVEARKGGFLRILGDEQATVIPFDRAALDRVGTPAEGPSDLLLLVSAAMTGDSKLSGRALFPYLFPGRPPGKSKGLDVDATWEHAGPGLTAAALSHGIKGLTVAGPNAHLRAKVKSWFHDIDGTFSVSGLDLAYRGYRINDTGVDLSIVGPPLHLALDRLRFTGPQGGSVKGAASVARDGTARFDLIIDDLITKDLLPSYLQPLLGGTAKGALSLRGNLPALSAKIDGIDLTMDRIRRGPLPRRLRITLGHPSVPAGMTLPSGPPAAAAADQLLVRLGSASFERGQFEVARLAATLFGADVQAGPLRLTWPQPRGGPPGPPALDLTVGVRNLDLGRALPGTGLTGVLGFSSRVRGPLNEVAAKVTFSPGAAVTVFDQTYGLPRQAGFGIHGGDQLVVPTLALAAPGGGSLSVAGALVLDRSVDLSVVAQGHRLDRVPFVSRALPSLGGTLAGRLHLSGEPLHPSLDGNVRLGGVTLAGVALGEGAVKLTALAPGRSTLKGSMFDHLTVAGNLDVGAGGPAFDATVDAAGLILDPFLPELPFLHGGRLRVGGRLTLMARSGRPLELGAALDSLLFAYGCRASRGDPRGPGCMVLESQGPVRARARGRMAAVELERAQFIAPESNFSLAGKVTDGAIDTQLRGRFSLGLLGPLFQIGGRRMLDASGIVDATFSARGPVTGPALAGEFNVVKPVRVSSSMARLEVRLPDGHLAFDAGGISSRGLHIEALGVKLALKGEAPLGAVPGGLSAMGARAGKAAAEARPLALDLSGTVDAALLPRFVPGFIAEAKGAADVTAKVRGSLARPSIDGEANLGAITFTTRPNKAQPQRFRVAVQGGRIVAKGNRVTVNQLIADVAPGGHVMVGPPGRPAEIDVVSLDPPVLGRISVPVVARALNADVGWLRLDDGAVDIDLKGDARGSMALSGVVELTAGNFSPNRRPAAPPRPKTPAPPPGPARAAPAPAQPTVKLDLRVRTDGKRFVIDPGWLPDLHLGLDVRVGGTLARPAVVWDAEGKGAYSKFALFLFRLFS